MSAPQSNEDHRQAAFQAAITACVNYYNGAMDDLRNEVAAVAKERDAAVQTAQQFRARLDAARVREATEDR